MGIGDKTRAKAYSRVLLHLQHALNTILLEDKAPQTFIQKPQKEKTQARKPLIFLRAGMTEGAPRGRAGYLAALVATRWAFGRRPSVSVSLARCQCGSGCNGGLVGPGPSSAPDFPRQSPRLGRSRAWQRARLSTAVSPTTPTNCPSTDSTALQPPIDPFNLNTI